MYDKIPPHGCRSKGPWGFFGAKSALASWVSAAVATLGGHAIDFTRSLPKVLQACGACCRLLAVAAMSEVNSSINEALAGILITEA